MNQKRILICCNRMMNIGGIEKALTTLLACFDTSVYQICLVIYDASGPFFAELPKNGIEIICTRSLQNENLLMDDLKHFRLGRVMSGLWHRLLLRLDRDWYAQIMHTYQIHRRSLSIPGHFDCAIAYSTDYSDIAMILQADADKRVAFVHGDATYHRRSAKLNDKLIRKLDMIYSVSCEAQDKFVQMHPKYQGRLDVIHNVLSVKDIRHKAQEPPEGMILDGIPVLCTVARLAPEKRQYEIPQIAKRLLDDGLVFRWYLVGGGPDHDRIAQQIQAHGVEDHVFLLGPKKNPYPYIKNCDLYVHLSVHEAYCLTVAEARILNRPIVSTNATGVAEQFNGNDGLVVQMSPEAVYQGIRKLLTDPELRQTFTRTLEQMPVYVEYDLPKIFDYISE